MMVTFCAWGFLRMTPPMSRSWGAVAKRAGLVELTTSVIIVDIDSSKFKRREWASNIKKSVSLSNFSTINLKGKESLILIYTYLIVMLKILTFLF